ncbi:hypothetical protein V8E53_006148 [Lactarius tabidus]
MPELEREIPTEASGSDTMLNGGYALQARVLGQDYVAGAVRISSYRELGCRAPKQPVALFLFLGPTIRQGQLTEAVRWEPYDRWMNLKMLTSYHNPVKPLHPVLPLLGGTILAHPSVSDSFSRRHIEARAEALERIKEFPLNGSTRCLASTSSDPTRSFLLVQRHIKLDVDDAVRKWLAQRGFSNFHGARVIAHVCRIACQYDTANFHLHAASASANVVANFVRRDGDTVEMRVEADGMSLQIYENHTWKSRMFGAYN